MSTLPDQVRAFLEEPRFAVLATIGHDGLPQQTVMWYDLDGDTIIMNSPSTLVKIRNLQRDPRASLCVEDTVRFITLVGRCVLIDDPLVLERENIRLAVRYQGQRRGSQRWATILRSAEPRTAIHMRIDRVLTRGFPQ